MGKLSRTEGFKIGFCMAVMFQPLEVLRTRMVLERDVYRGFSGFLGIGK